MIASILLAAVAVPHTGQIAACILEVQLGCVVWLTIVPDEHEGLHLRHSQLFVEEANTKIHLTFDEVRG